MQSAVRDSPSPRGWSRNEASRSRTVALPAILGAALAVPLAVYASIGAFSRYTADDFCWAGTLRAEGFFNAQVFYYTVYSPRYAFTFLVNLVELAGPAIVPALPAAAILVWLAVLTWTFTQFGVEKFRALVLAELAAFAALQTAPDLAQSLYWQTGMLTYLSPLVLATVYVAGLAGTVRRCCRGKCHVAFYCQRALSLCPARRHDDLRLRHGPRARAGRNDRAAVDRRLRARIRR